MALANYADLQASIADWSHRTDLTSIVPDFVAMAEARISRDLRLRKQITSTTLTAVGGSQDVALPTDWLELENVTLGTTPARQMTYVTVEQLDSKYPQGGYNAMPAVYTIEGDILMLGPVPDADYSIDLIYYARLPSVITSSTNWLLTNHPNIYLFACLIEAYYYSQHPDQVALYTQRYNEGVKQLQDQDDRATHSGSTLRVKVV